MAKKKKETVEEVQADVANEEAVEEKSDKNIVESAVETVAETVSDVVETVAETVTDVVEAVTGNGDETTDKKSRKRAEKVGIVFSDKMTNTVVVRVNRMVKHPLYHKYMKRRKKFMAHDELGATEGDRVRIVQTRPLSARKRWRVVEIIQKAQK